MRFDSHQHFWQLANEFTQWPGVEQAAIYRDFQSEDIKPWLAESGISGTILVQASPSLAESEYCLELAGQLDFVKGVVGWIDFEAIDAAEQLAHLATDPLLRGLRPMVQSIAKPGWLLRPEFTPIFEEMCRRNLRLDALVLSHQIADLDRLAQRHPGLPIVLDHAGKPPIASGNIDAWAEAIDGLAGNRSVCCKLSGLWTEAGGEHSAEIIRPYVDHIVSAFGTGRLMWGSDWPVVELAGQYSDWLHQCEQLLCHLPPAEFADVFGGNAARFYGIEADNA